MELKAILAVIETLKNEDLRNNIVIGITLLIVAIILIILIPLYILLNPLESIEDFLVLMNK